MAQQVTGYIVHLKSLLNVEMCLKPYVFAYYDHHSWSESMNWKWIPQILQKTVVWTTFLDVAYGMSEYDWSLTA